MSKGMVAIFIWLSAMSMFLVDKHLFYLVPKDEFDCVLRITDHTAVDDCSAYVKHNAPPGWDMLFDAANRPAQP